MRFDPLEPTIRAPRDPWPLIESVEDWLRLAAPARGEAHWKPERSAMECARAWFRDGVPRVPSELRALFVTCGDDEDAPCPGLHNFRATTAIPERKTFFADSPHGPRNHDVLDFGSARGGTAVIGIEAKADESFDRPVGARLEDALHRRERGESTHFPERVDMFCRCLFGFPLLMRAGEVDRRVAELPYQLLPGVAGTMVEAVKHKAAHAAFIVHVLESDSLDREKLEANERCLALLCRLLRLDPPANKRDWLVGPATYPGCPEVPPLSLCIGLAHGRC